MFQNSCLSILISSCTKDCARAPKSMKQNCSVKEKPHIWGSDPSNRARGLVRIRTLDFIGLSNFVVLCFVDVLVLLAVFIFSRLYFSSFF
jgi:hypothetical protein